MEPRHRAWKKANPTPHPDLTSVHEAERLAQVMQEGETGEFWTHLKAQIEAMADHAASQFVDKFTADYSTYLAWHSAYHAHLATLALPEVLIQRAATLRAKTERKE